MNNQSYIVILHGGGYYKSGLDTDLSKEIDVAEERKDAKKMSKSEAEEICSKLFQNNKRAYKAEA